MDTQSRVRNYLVRYGFFVVGIFLMSLGVALTVRAGIGTTPISSLPVVFSTAFPLSLGTTTVIINVLLIILQILLLRRDYPRFQLWQLPAGFLFGGLCDLSIWLTRGIEVHAYWAQLLVSVAGTLVLAVGVWMQVTPKVLNLPGEGAVIALCHVTGAEFGKVKVIFDWTLVALAAISSLLLMGRLEGVREGTVISAFLVGILVRFFSRRFTFLARWTQPIKQVETP
ncbi:YczE/YyaS/YitT family protein [Granulicoccus phenolivorans]|uniref:YczE/YyaS/YitT family protein n=1 Tax=Granulicoccus phenolivorans TaxID=266854 RepID=UPI00054FAC8D|nr:DUF6198 family protein [Granulicoccus phenolivorans]